MRKFLISAAVLLLAMPAAFADPPADRGNRGHGGGEGRGRAQAESNQPPQQMDRGDRGRGGFARGERNRGPAPQMAIQAPADRGDRGRGGFDRGERDRGPAPQMATRAPADLGVRGRNFERRDTGRAGGFESRDRRAFNDFNRDGRTTYRSPSYGGPRRDFSGFRDFHRNFRASRRFDLPSYRRPAGWYSHRWVFGEFLPAAFWIRDYWIFDFDAYDLPPPPYGAIWVRVDRDALLVDEESGEIITVVYDVFY